MADWLYADLISDGLPMIRFWGKDPGTESRSGYWISDDSGAGEGIEDWYSTPELKTETTEMQMGDGAHFIFDDAILYAAKVVTLNWFIDAETREEMLSLYDVLQMYTHRQVNLRVVDAQHDTFVQGYLRPTMDPKFYPSTAAGTLEITCTDPRRYGAYERNVHLTSASRSGGGLVYDNQRYLHYPLSYGDAAPVLQNYGTLVNAGSATAYPLITVHGPFPQGIRLDFGDRTLRYDSSVFSAAVPLELDCLTRTATMGGADVTRRVTYRGWPSVAPGASLGVSVQSEGQGWVDVTIRDTYI